MPGIVRRAAAGNEGCRGHRGDHAHHTAIERQKIAVPVSDTAGGEGAGMKISTDSRGQAGSALGGRAKDVNQATTMKRIGSPTWSIQPRCCALTGAQAARSVAGHFPITSLIE
jgi:hypothetical protein